MAKTSLSVLKRERQNARRKLVNRRSRKTLKDKVKEFRAVKTREEAVTLLPSVQSEIDSSARKNIIHRNTASRLKSRLAKEIADLK